ncbi:hypothetical protein SAMN05216436_103148 [bacterium A37T11]|nr:hypothetical protein SAMN05216436_103148 [bacterium A37T11]
MYWFIQISDFLRKYVLTLALGISLLLYWASQYVLRGLDVTSAPIDPGVLSAIPLTVLAVLTFMALTGPIIRQQWPVLDTYQEIFFEHTFKTLLSWQKVVIYLCLYLSLLFAFVATLSAVL